MKLRNLAIPEFWSLFLQLESKKQAPRLIKTYKVPIHEFVENESSELNDTFYSKLTFKIFKKKILQVNIN